MKDTQGANKYTVDWNQFQKTYVQAREKFLQYEDVIGVGYGARQDSPSEGTNELAIIVLVRKKLASDPVLKKQLFPPTLDGFPIEIREPRIEPDIEHAHHVDKHHSDLMMIEWHRLMANPSTTFPPQTDRVGQVFVIEDNDTLTSFVGDVRVGNWGLAYKYFLQHWGDDYDFVAIVLDHLSGMPKVGSFGDAIYNDVVGINYHFDLPPNMGNYNIRGYYGSNRLQGLENLYAADTNNPPSTYLPNPTTRFERLMEIAHRWGAYVLFKNNATDNTSHRDLLNYTWFHWANAFSPDYSPLDGDGFFWRSQLYPHGHVTHSYDGIPDDDQYTYCNLDLYLMGMLAPTEVGLFTYFPGFTATSVRINDIFTDLIKTSIGINNIVLAHGGRTPDAGHSPRSFRQAFIVITKDLAQGKALAALIDNDRITHTTDFRSATRSRSVLDTYLYESAYDGICIRDDASDTGTNEPRPAPFWNSPDIWVRQQRDQNLAFRNQHEDTRRGYSNWVYVQVNNFGSQPSREITVNLFRANYAGTEFQYPQDWRLQDQIGSVIIQSVPPGGNVVAEFEWQRNMIPSALWHPCLLAEILPIHPTQTLLRTVEKDRRLAQKNITIVGYDFLKVISNEARQLRFPFRIGTGSLSARWVRVRVHQIEGDPVRSVVLELGREDWLQRFDIVGPLEDLEGRAGPGRPMSMNDLARGGRVIDDQGLSRMDVTDPRGAAEIALPLLEAESRELTLIVDCGERTLPQDVKFEITQLDNQNKVVGGVYLLISKEASDR